MSEHKITKDNAYGSLYASWLQQAEQIERLTSALALFAGTATQDALGIPGLTPALAWSDAPSRAVACAVVPAGNYLIWFSDTPKRAGDNWYGAEVVRVDTCTLALGQDWRTTMRQRQDCDNERAKLNRR